MINEILTLPLPSIIKITNAVTVYFYFHLPKPHKLISYLRPRQAALLFVFDFFYWWWIFFLTSLQVSMFSLNNQCLFDIFCQHFQCIYYCVYKNRVWIIMYLFKYLCTLCYIYPRNWQTISGKSINLCFRIVSETNH